MKPLLERRGVGGSRGDEVGGGGQGQIQWAVEYQARNSDLPLGGGGEGTCFKAHLSVGGVQGGP